MSAASAAMETAVVVLVRAAEQVVGAHRASLDPAAGWGVGAHVTVLYPFVPPDLLDATVVSRLAAVLASVPSFDCRFTSCRWFDEDVLWLAPEPSQPFAELIAAVWQAFPDHPPYAGAFAEVVPHLTVGERRGATLQQLRSAEETVARQLPVPTHVDRAVLMAGAPCPGCWRVLHELPLGRPSQAPRHHVS